MSLIIKRHKNVSNLKFLNIIILAMISLLVYTALFPHASVRASVLGEWDTLPAMPTSRSGHVALAANNKIYVIGGSNNWLNEYEPTVYGAVEEYNPISNSWATKTSMPTPSFSSGAALGSNGKIYIVGGSYPNANTTLDTLQEYDPSTDTWSLKASMLYPRYGARVVATPNGKIYAIGGNNPSYNPVSGSSQVDEYDIATNAWTRKADAPTIFPYGIGSAVYLNGKIYLLSSATLTNEIYSYEPVTGTWSTGASMPPGNGHEGVRVSGMAITLGPDGRIYALGGAVNTRPAGGSFYGAVDTVVAYDPVNDNWAYDTSLNVPRMKASATTLGDKIYVIGGDSYSDTCESSGTCDALNSFESTRVYVDTIIDAGPTNFTQSTSASFLFHATQPSTFECSLDEGPYTICTAPQNYSSLVEGSHTFKVRAIASPNNIDPSEAIYIWIIDNNAPVSAFSTMNNALLLGNSNINGVVTDDLSGIAEVRATFVPLTPGAVEVTRTATLNCASSSQTSCSWSTNGPTTSGRYRAEIRGLDRAGNLENAISINVIVL